MASDGENALLASKPFLPGYAYAAGPSASPTAVSMMRAARPSFVIGSQVRMGEAPRARRALVAMHFRTANLAERVFIEPPPELAIPREQRSPSVQRAAIGQPAVEHIGLQLARAY